MNQSVLKICPLSFGRLIVMMALCLVLGACGGDKDQKGEKNEDPTGVEVTGEEHRLNQLTKPGQGDWSPFPESDRGEIPGFLDVMSYGFSTTVSVNGRAYSSVENTGMSHQLLGGLVEGTNSIQIAIEPLAGESIPDLTVSIRMVHQGEVRKLFHYAPNSAGQCVIEDEFIVTTKGIDELPSD